MYAGCVRPALFHLIDWADTGSLVLDFDLDVGWGRGRRKTIQSGHLSRFILWTFDPSVEGCFVIVFVVKGEEERGDNEVGLVSSIVNWQIRARRKSTILVHILGFLLFGSFLSDLQVGKLFWN